MLCSCIILAIWWTCISAISRDDYLKLRNNLIQSEKQMQTGGHLSLNDDEMKVNDLLMHFKQKEIDIGEMMNGTYLPAVNFMLAKDLIEQSEVFKLLKKMPKGAALHVHDSSIADMMWLIKNATYDPLCYMCINQSTGNLVFHFFAQPPNDTECRWQRVNAVRSQFADPQQFDDLLYKNLTLMVDNPDSRYPTVDIVWTRFMSLFETSSGLIFYAPVFRSFYREALQEFYDDNVQYMEMRAMLPPVYELDGTLHDKDWLIKVYSDTAKQFTDEHADFVGAKTIYTSSRYVATSDVRAAVKDALRLLKQFPEHFAGYDLVGQEDHGRPLLDYLDALLYPSQIGASLPYFFHAGETDWNDVATDLNLVDALLLNASRIGHGYSILKHPVVEQRVRDKSIALEICPISNQVLRLVRDLRNHPASVLMATGAPMVISSDDPTLWGARGLSYDFYEALMGLGGAWANIATIKQLAMDSLRYSSLTVVEKQAALKLWQQKWDQFIQQTVHDYGLA